MNGRVLLQQATRATWTAKGLDVSELTDIQMSDNQFYLLFPNLFITIRAGEATVITAVPHPGGALEQDYEQMERQQKGLRQSTLKYMALTKQEVRLAHFRSVLDGWLGESRWT